MSGVHLVISNQFIDEEIRVLICTYMHVVPKLRNSLSGVTGSAFLMGRYKTLKSYQLSLLESCKPMVTFRIDS